MGAYEHHCDDPDSFPVTEFLQLGEGKGTGILIVGESLGRDGWRESGRAFYRVNGTMLPTGTNLNKLLQDFGLSVDGRGDTDRCGFTDLVKCYVPDNEHLLRECGHRCWPIFERQLQSHGFKLLVLLGAKTLKIFNREAGTKLYLGKLKTVGVSGSEYSVFPIYHPSGAYPIKGRQASEWNQEFFDEAQGELNALLKGIA